MAVALVRYVSPFGSPAHLPREEAARYLVQDEALWRLLASVGALDERQRRIGPPRLDDPQFHLSDLPAWREPEDDPFDLIRELVPRAERAADDAREPFVVAERAGAFAAFPKRVVIDGDAIRWETR